MPCYLKGQKRIKKKTKRRRCLYCYKLVAEGGKAHTHRIVQNDRDGDAKYDPKTGGYLYKREVAKTRTETTLVDICPRVAATELIKELMAKDPKDAPKEVLITRRETKCGCGCGRKKIIVTHVHEEKKEEIKA